MKSQKYFGLTLKAKILVLLYSVGPAVHPMPSHLVIKQKEQGV